MECHAACGTDRPAGRGEQRAMPMRVGSHCGHGADIALMVAADVAWADVVTEMRRRAAARIAEEGYFGVTIRMGVLVCR